MALGDGKFTFSAPSLASSPSAVTTSSAPKPPATSTPDPRRRKSLPPRAVSRSGSSATASPTIKPSKSGGPASDQSEPIVTLDGWPFNLPNHPFTEDKVCRVWFDDGDVIVEAGGTQFKVYEKMLARRSSVFRDIIADLRLDQAQGALECVCPIIKLQEDAYALGQFLASIYGEGICDPPRLKNIALVLGISSKYKADKLMNDYAFLLLRIFPVNYDEFIKSIQNNWDSIIPDLHSSAALIRFVEAAHNFPQPLLKRFLPIAYWLICLHENVEGITVKTKVKRVADVILVGRARILEFVKTACLSGFTSPCEGEDQSNSCLPYRIKCMLRILSDMDTRNLRWLTLPNDRLPIVMAEKGIKKGDTTCSCRGVMEWDAARKIWEELPRLFGVAHSWPTLMAEWDQGLGELRAPKLVVRS